MKKNLTELVFLLDRSGSMGGMEADTIGGYNGFLRKQKKEEGNCLVTTVLFDNYSETVHDRIDLSEIAPLTEKEYYVRGSTALLDALGSSIEHISTIHKYARPEDCPEHTVFVITTDGMENASTKYTYDKVQALVKEKEVKEGWNFVFLGANIDAVSEAKRYGISPEHAVTVFSDEDGAAAQFEAASMAVTQARACGSIRPDWAQPVAEDMKKREKHHHFFHRK